MPLNLPICSVSREDERINKPCARVVHSMQSQLHFDCSGYKLTYRAAVLVVAAKKAKDEGGDHLI